MKTLMNKLFILFICTIVFCSCEKDEDKIVVKKGGVVPVLSSSASAVVLSKADADKEAITFSWTAAEYGFDAGVKYSLQLDKKGNNFAKPKIVLLDSIHKKTYKGGELNWLALNLGLPKAVATEIEVRVKSGVSSNIDSLNSNTTSFTVTPYIAAPVLSGSSPTIVLAKDKANDVVITFTGTDADFGSKDAEIKYFLEFGKKGTNFSKVKREEFSANKIYKVKEINQIAKGDLGMFVGNVGEMEIRLKASVSSKVDSVSSNILTYSITPYASADLVDYPNLYMIGTATEFGNDTTKATPMFRSLVNSKYEYTYTGYFKLGGLKFVTGNSTVPMWGSTGGTGVALREKKEDAEPLAFSVLEAGYHTVTLNIENLTYKIEDYTTTVPAAYGDMKMNGDFNSWGPGIAMTSSVLNPHIWRLEYTFSGASSMKFQTGNWSSQFGPTKDWSSLYGVLDGTADNLYILTGTYVITFNDLTKQYLYLKK